MYTKKICLCHHVTKEDIKLKYQSGARTLGAIIEETQATTGCGSCFRDVYHYFLHLQYNSSHKKQKKLFYE